MSDSDSLPGAREKLARSRAELLLAMGYQGDDLVHGRAAASHADPRPSLLAKLGLGVLARWWTRHPLNAAVELSRPLLDRYAQRSPGRLVACSAGVGGLLVILKPWRLLSLATVVTLLFKGSDIAATVSSLVGSVRGTDPRNELPPLG